MTIWAIVPVKPLLIGKSRLGSVLSGEERARLNRMLLERTLGVLKDTPSIDGSLVVSRDPEVLAIAREFGSRTVLEHGQTQTDLNLALITGDSRRKGIRNQWDTGASCRSSTDFPGGYPSPGGSNTKNLRWSSSPRTVTTMGRMPCS